jgi:hypothetical protein
VGPWIKVTGTCPAESCREATGCSALGFWREVLGFVAVVPGIGSGTFYSMVKGLCFFSEKDFELKTKVA